MVGMFWVRETFVFRAGLDHRFSRRQTAFEFLRPLIVS